MSRKLPPLNALKVFETSARLKSFTKAADELCVTPAAVSQQIKTLERYLQIQLFSRTHKNLQLTAAGKAYYPTISEGINILSKASQRLTAFQTGPHLTVSAFPSVASKWLAPKLFHWLDQHSDVSVKVLATHSEADFQTEDIDYRISYGHLNYQDVNTQQLFVDQIFPVCSPQLLQEIPLNKPEDLANHILLHVAWGSDYKSLPSWKTWMQAAGFEGLNTQDGPEFNLSSIAIQAAIEGKGVMLGQRMMVTEDILAGRLIKPFDIVLSMEEAYHVIYPDEALEKPYAVDFLEWIIRLGRE